MGKNRGKCIMYRNNNNVLQGKTVEVLGDLVIRGKTIGLKTDSLDVSGTVSAGQFEGRSRIAVRQISFTQAETSVNINCGFRPSFVEIRCKPEDVTAQNPSAEVDIMTGFVEEETLGSPTQGVCQMHIGNHTFTRSKSDSCIVIFSNSNTNMLTRVVLESINETGITVFVAVVDPSRADYYFIFHE